MKQHENQIQVSHQPRHPNPYFWEQPQADKKAQNWTSLKMAPKKSSISPFTVFLHEKRSENAKKGILINMDEAVKMFHPHYKNLNASEKAIYEKKAKELKQKQKNDPTKKFDTYGISMAERKADLEREKKAKKEMLDYIKNTVVTRKNTDCLKDHVFHFIHFNYTVVTEEQEYIPCEVAIAKFSLKKGVENIYHCLIKPGEIPVGYAFAAKEHSEKTHEIPPFGTEETDGSYSGQVIRMNAFLRNKEGDIEPVYTLQENIVAVKGMIKYIFQHGGEYKQAQYRVYDIDALVYQLIKQGDEYVHDVSIRSVLDTADQYDFEMGISCSFHKNKDNPKFCSVHAVKAWALSVTDLCSDYYDLESPASRSLASLATLASSSGQTQMASWDDNDNDTVPEFEDVEVEEDISKLNLRRQIVREPVKKPSRGILYPSLNKDVTRVSDPLPANGNAWKSDSYEGTSQLSQSSNFSCQSSAGTSPYLSQSEFPTLESSAVKRGRGRGIAVSWEFDKTKGAGRGFR